MKKAIGDKGKKSHLTGIPLAPEEIEPAYEKWEQADPNCLHLDNSEY